ncbi:hypothetical protein JCGZ_22147 [Jatropha curcas]|uniref:Uncharacterized protein n=1 Tax=Jatropha curcas TaxID=180498 RepID=A0A067LIU6_JATCU|nr:hypothetical protein JCGZ_22147 [Jatropha curcas]
MGETSIPVSNIEKVMEKIVAASLDKLLRSDKDKDHAIVEDDEAKGKSERKEQLDDIWQDEEFFTMKMPTKKVESKSIIS